MSEPEDKPTTPANNESDDDDSFYAGMADYVSTEKEIEMKRLSKAIDVAQAQPTNIRASVELIARAALDVPEWFGCGAPFGALHQTRQ